MIHHSAEYDSMLHLCRTLVEYGFIFSLAQSGLSTKGSFKYYVITYRGRGVQTKYYNLLQYFEGGGSGQSITVLQ